MEYIQTKEQLERVSIKKLGTMTQGTYQEFLAKGKELCDNPKLIIETELNQPSVFGLTEVVYPVAEFEWQEFSIDSLAKYTPVVYVVDGNKYTAGI